MTFKEKRKYKRIATIFTTLAYTMVVLFFTLIGLSIARVVDVISLPLPHFISLILAISPVFFSLTFAMIGQWALVNRSIYKRMIKRYREYRHFNMALDYIEEGNLSKAINLYNGMPIGYLREFLYSHLIAYFMLGTDEKQKKQAIEKIGALRETYCHHNINLDYKTNQKGF